MLVFNYIFLCRTYMCSMSFCMMCCYAVINADGNDDDDEYDDSRRLCLRSFDHLSMIESFTPTITSHFTITRKFLIVCSVQATMPAGGAVIRDDIAVERDIHQR